MTTWGTKSFTARGLTTPLRALRAVGFRLRSALGHTGFTKFIVLSRSRTGSNMLVSLLDSHPRVVAEGEIVARLDGRDARKRLASELEERFRKTRQWEIDGDRRFQRHPLISVCSEDLVQDPHRSLAGLLDFLDLRDFQLPPAPRQQNPGRLDRKSGGEGKRE